MWEVIGPVEGGDKPESNMDIQSSKNRFVVSGDTLAGMFMVTELTADDNARVPKIAKWTTCWYKLKKKTY